MPSEITASVGKPAPLPPRPTLYGIVWFVGGAWRVGYFGQAVPDIEIGNVLVTIPGDPCDHEWHQRVDGYSEEQCRKCGIPRPAPPPARDEVREAAEAVLKQYDVAWSISWLDNLKVSIVALRAALATKGPAK